MTEKPQAVRLLLVEDDDEDAAIFCRHMKLLTRYRVAIERVASAEDGLVRLVTTPFDLIVMDLNLSGSTNGIELLNRLHSKGVRTPAVMVTGSGDEMKAVEAMKAGAYDYLVKDGLNPDLLERTIRNARTRYALEEERARMLEKLAEMSVTDELAGLANRRYLIRKLREEVRRSERTGHVFALLMIDLDRFKRVNDQYGHQQGADVLTKSAAALKRNLRTTDFVARWGGDEFCVLLPATPSAGARRVAEKLRKAFKTLPDPIPTISVGVASWKRHCSAEELLNKSDKALYRAKGRGRDRVAVYGESQRVRRLNAGT